ncbi:MAG: xylose isomerase [Acidobacteria bacterium]|nr:MAG: xylose isomerase [Acidobacteriota bacterium]
MDGAGFSRRTFLAMLGAAPFAASARGALAREVPVGLELYSVRTELAKDLRNTVTAVAKMGYRVVEFYSPYFGWTLETAKSVRTLLDDLGIECRSTHNGSESFTADGLKKAIDLNAAIGSKYIVLAHPGTVSGLDGWKAVADKLTAAAEQLRPHRMMAGYHNHQLEWTPVNGKRPIEVIAAGTPSDVALQLDVGTCVETGGDPVAWINANPGRIRSMHCKDWGAGGRGYAVAFGEGDVPWKKIFDAAESAGGIEYYLIEQEESPDQLAMAERCLANWKKLRM